MVVAKEDVTTPVDISEAAYQEAREPKELVVLPGRHFEVYSGPNLTSIPPSRCDSCRETLCK